jgi:hypothetical protein
MRKFALFSVLALAVLLACGSEEPAATGPASPAEAVPEGAMMYLAFEDPAAVLGQVDSYMAEGAPAMGDGVASEWVLEALGCASFDEVSSRYGIDPHGSLIIFQKGMGNSVGVALSVTDEEAVWSYMEEMGLQLEEGEPLDGQPVRTVAVGGGFSLQMAVKRGVLVGAVSRPGLSEMVGLLDSSRTSSPVPRLDPATVYMGVNVSALAPILSAQMPMIRQQAMMGMQQSPDAPPQAVMDIIGLYFDAFGVIVEQTEHVSWTMTLGEQELSTRMVAEFVPGSELERLMAPVEVTDLTGMLPFGNVMVARADLNPELGRVVTAAFAEAAGFEADSTVMELAEAFSTSSAFSMMQPEEGNPFHMLAVYHIGEEESLETIRQGMASMMSMTSSIMEGMPIELTEPEIVEMGGREYLTYGENVDMAADSIGGASFSMSFWLTVEDGYLYLESAPEPTLLPEVIDGEYAGETIESSGLLDYPDDWEMAFAMNVGAYMANIMSISPDSSGIPPGVAESMSGSPLWVRAGADMQEGRVVCESSVDGGEIVSFVMNIVMLAGQEG